MVRMNELGKVRRVWNGKEMERTPSSVETREKKAVGSVGRELKLNKKPETHQKSEKYR